jgi:hypothetical protein
MTVKSILQFLVTGLTRGPQAYREAFDRFSSQNHRDQTILGRSTKAIPRVDSPILVELDFDGRNRPPHAKR